MNKITSNFKSIITLLLEIFPTEQACINYFEKKRWKEKVISPFDAASKVYKCANNRYRCKSTGKYFSVRTGTVFENSKLPLQKWFVAFYLLSSNKKGISSRQLVKYISITQKSAWFVLHRLRCAFEHPNFKTMLENFVEIDETFIGGKNKNRHWNKKVPKCQGRNWKDKIPVLGIIERSGNLITQVVPNTQQNTIEPIVKANIKQETNIYTDEWYAYKDLGKWFNHQIVNHSAKQYVNGKATTNRVENAWSHLKRLINTYHWISRKHSQKYVDEFTLRFNTRKYSDQDRFDLVLFSSVGKHLTYQQLIN
jgi:transposase-like protein